MKWDYPRTIPAKSGLIWFSGFREEDLNVIFYQNMPNLHNRYKLAERKISQKNPEYMLNYSSLCSCSKKFELIIKICLICIIGKNRLKEKGTIPATLGLIWFSGEDLNVKVYDVRQTPSDGNRLHFFILSFISICNLKVQG